MPDENIGTWEAWTYPQDFIPHLYVKGTFPINGEKPIFTLHIVSPQGFNPNILILQLEPDAVDPNGKQTGSTEPYSQALFQKHYDFVTICTKSIASVAHIAVEKRKRK